jgi:hypothetical protein
MSLRTLWNRSRRDQIAVCARLLSPGLPEEPNMAHHLEQLTCRAEVIGRSSTRRTVKVRRRHVLSHRIFCFRRRGQTDARRGGPVSSNLASCASVAQAAALAAVGTVKIVFKTCEAIW